MLLSIVFAEEMTQSRWNMKNKLFLYDKVRLLINETVQGSALSGSKHMRHPYSAQPAGLKLFRYCFVYIESRPRAYNTKYATT